MAMLIFSLTVALLGVAICAGHRLNMYLYASGALGGREHRMRLAETQEYALAAETETYPLSQPQDVPLDYGLHYVRTGFLMFVILTSAIVVGLIALIVAVL